MHLIFCDSSEEAPCLQLSCPLTRPPLCHWEDAEWTLGMGGGDLHGYWSLGLSDTWADTASLTGCGVSYNANKGANWQEAKNCYSGSGVFTYSH